jgi:hypothetical protein
MKTILPGLALLALLSSPAFADPNKDETAGTNIGIVATTITHMTVNTNKSSGLGTVRSNANGSTTATTRKSASAKAATGMGMTNRAMGTLYTRE